MPGTANLGWVNSLYVQPTQTTIFTSQTPTGAAGPDAPVNLGMKFRSTSAGFIVGLRFYRLATMVGPHTLTLYDSSGTVLASVAVGGGSETISGWQNVMLPTAYAIASATTYMVALYVADSVYEAENNYFTSTGVTNGVLTALQTGVDGPNGVYGYGGAPAFPTSTFADSFYWVDVIFQLTL